jgi:hypothetical protein
VGRPGLSRIGNALPQPHAAHARHGGPLPGPSHCPLTRDLSLSRGVLAGHAPRRSDERRADGQGGRVNDGRHCGRLQCPTQHTNHASYTHGASQHLDVSGVEVHSSLRRLRTSYTTHEVCTIPLVISPRPCNAPACPLPSRPKAALSPPPYRNGRRAAIQISVCTVTSAAVHRTPSRTPSIAPCPDTILTLVLGSLEPPPAGLHP